MQFIDALDNKIVIVCGATASGKSSLALELARKIDCVIINADALQVYKEIPLLTAQPSALDLQLAPHAFYGSIQCGEHFSVTVWLEQVKVHIENCFAHHKTPILVGGSGFYIKALIDGLSYVPDISQGTKDRMNILVQEKTPEQLHSLLFEIDRMLAMRIAKSDLQRVTRGLAVFFETGIPLSTWQTKNLPYCTREKFFMINLHIDRDTIYKRCDTRFMDMVQAGIVEEVEALMQAKPEITYPKALGLYEIISYLRHEITLDEAISKAQQHTRNYAKRQLTWFRHQMRYDHIIN